MTNREMLIEFLKGAATSTLFFVVIMGAMALSIGNGDKGSPPKERFKVVDQYGPCEVVRYAPKNGANYAYFLDCK